MKRSIGIFAVTLFLAAATLEGAERRSVPEAVKAGLKLVQKAAANYPNNRKCFSCHHQTMPMQAMVTAREHGFEIDEALLKSQAEFTHAFFEKRVEKMREGTGIGGRAMTVGYGLWALDLAGFNKNETTAAMVTYLLKRQKEDGRWSPPSHRPPLEESDVTCTVLAVYAMKHFATDEQKEAVKAAAERAYAWVKDAPVESQEDACAKLTGLALMGGPKDDWQQALKELLARQREDGGFSQLPEMESDAYATGLTLFTLAKVRFPTDDPAYQRGVKFLLETQLEDGSWYVKSRSKPIQTMFDNGDPHGTDQFISTPSTAWAVAALAATLPKVEKKIRPPQAKSGAGGED